MLSKESTLYEPLSYNNGASWPFLTGWAALALFKGGRSDAGWQYLDALADLTFLEARGYMPELFSGRPPPLDGCGGAAPAVRDDRLRLGRHARPGRPRGNRPGTAAGAASCRRGGTFLRVKNLRWRDGRGSLEVRRDARGAISYVVEETKAPGVPVVLEPPLPPGAERAKGGTVGGRTDAAGEAARTRSALAFTPGIQLIPEQPPLSLGDTPQRARILETTFEKGVYTARLQVRRGRVYRFRLDVPFPVVSIDGGREVARDGRMRVIEVAVPAGPTEWVDTTLQLGVGTPR